MAASLLAVQKYRRYLKFNFQLDLKYEKASANLKVFGNMECMKNFDGRIFTIKYVYNDFSKIYFVEKTQEDNWQLKKDNYLYYKLQFIMFSTKVQFLDLILFNIKKDNAIIIEVPFCFDDLKIAFDELKDLFISDQFMDCE